MSASCCADASKRACVVASLRRCVEEWDVGDEDRAEDGSGEESAEDGSDEEGAEGMIVSMLKSEGPLELGTIVTHILHKVPAIDIGERILDCLGAHTFDMTPVVSYCCNVWWSAGDCKADVGPVGEAVLRLAPTWVGKLLSHLRVGGRLGELTNEVAVAASHLSYISDSPTHVRVGKLTKVLRMLLAAGCDVNAKAGGFTALHHVASALAREEVYHWSEKAKQHTPASEVDYLLAPLCELLVEGGARFDICGDYGDGHKYDAERKYRGWKPPTGTKSGEPITLPHPSATALDIFVARRWRRCVAAVLRPPSKRRAPR